VPFQVPFSLSYFHSERRFLVDNPKICTPKQCVPRWFFWRSVLACLCSLPTPRPHWCFEYGGRPGYAPPPSQFHPLPRFLRLVALLFPTILSALARFPFGDFATSMPRDRATRLRRTTWSAVARTGERRACRGEATVPTRTGAWQQRRAVRLPQARGLLTRVILLHFWRRCCSTIRRIGNLGRDGTAAFHSRALATTLRVAEWRIDKVRS